MLNKVEIRRREFFKTISEIAHQRYGLQEDFRQNDCGADIQVNASTIKVSGHGTEEAKIPIAGFAEVLSGCLRMSVNDIRAQGHVHSDWDLSGIRLREDAQGGVFSLEF